VRIPCTTRRFVPNDEPERFSVLVFGDPQPRDMKEVDWLAHDVLDRIDTQGAVLGLALGDIAFDDLTTLEPLTEFYPAEKYHQDYVRLNPSQPYVRSVAIPKVEKVREKFADQLKEQPAK